MPGLFFIAPLKTVSRDPFFWIKHSNFVKAFVTFLKTPNSLRPDFASEFIRIKSDRFSTELFSNWLGSRFRNKSDRSEINFNPKLSPGRSISIIPELNSRNADGFI